MKHRPLTPFRRRRQQAAERTVRRYPGGAASMDPGTVRKVPDGKPKNRQE